MKTIRELVNAECKKKVYIYLANDKIGKNFMKQAEEEGFVFGDGVKPTERNYSEIIAVNDDNTINFVNSIGRMAFGSGAENVGNRKLVRVDYEKYINGESDYLYKKKSQI